MAREWIRPPSRDALRRDLIACQSGIRCRERRAQHVAANGKTTRTDTERASASEGGGESGIRTHGRVSPTHAFQACSLNHSDISPHARGAPPPLASLDSLRSRATAAGASPHSNQRFASGLALDYCTRQSRRPVHAIMFRISNCERKCRAFFLHIQPCKKSLALQQQGRDRAHGRVAFGRRDDPHRPHVSSCFGRPDGRARRCPNGHRNYADTGRSRTR